MRSGAPRARERHDAAARCRCRAPPLIASFCTPRFHSRGGGAPGRGMDSNLGADAKKYFTPR
jgi:hypothetical protein